MIQIQKRKIEQFLEEFRKKCDRHSIALKIDNSPHYPDKLASHFNSTDKTITLSSPQIEQISDQLNIPLLDQWRIVAYHELGHFFKGTDEHEAWDWVAKNLEIDSGYLEVARGNALYASLISAKGNWNLIKKAASSPIITKFIALVTAGMSRNFRNYGIEFTPGNCWSIARKNADYNELELIGDAFSPKYKFDLIYSDDLLELEIAAIALYKSIGNFL